MALKRLFVCFVAFAVAVPFLAPRESRAIVPLLIEFAPAAARVVVGQFAAAGLATVVNPDPAVKQLAIPSGNRALKVSFGLASSVAAAALFATFSGFKSSPGVPTLCNQLNVASQGTADLNAIKSRLAAAYPASSFGYVDRSNGADVWQQTGSRGMWISPINCSGPTSATKPAEDVMWADLSTNQTQAKTDKLVSDLTSFAQTNPADFDAMVQLSDFAAQQPDMLYSTASGTVTISSDGAGGVTVSGGSPALSLDASGAILADGQPATGPAAPAPNASPTPPTGTANATGSDMGAVVSAINADKAQSVINTADGVAAVQAAASQASTDSAAIKSAIDAKQTDCDKFPNSAGCSDLGAISAAPVVTERITDFSTFVISPVQFTFPAFVCPSVTVIPMSNGQNFTYDTSVACDFVGWLRPAILGTAWFAAAMIFTGAFRNG